MHQSQTPHEPATDAPAPIADLDDSLDLHDLWRGWVTPSERKRCTYVTRDERPLAAAGHGNIARL